MAPLRWQVGFDTDVGGGRENQDDCFVWSRVEEGICILCVLDGHGKEVGKIAANIARSSLQEYFDTNYRELKSSPYNCLVKAHMLAHSAIKSGFRTELIQQGYDVFESPEGYLLKSKKGFQQWSCVHGGSTCSICAIIDGVLFTANVGDSSGLLCCTQPLLSKSDISTVGDAAVADSTRKKHLRTINMDDSDDWRKSQCLVVTAEHSPESPYEFLRLRDFRPRVGCAEQPSLNIVYDTPAHEKAKCPSVFNLDETGCPTVTGRGSYYKNVRHEWASLVSTPSSARFQDALAFTRSLGDLHLHTYGVTHLPEVQTLNLLPLLHALQTQSRTASESGSDPSMSSSSGETETETETETEIDAMTEAEGDINCMSQTPLNVPPSPPVLCLVLATDGVWDNWTYEDLNNFVMDTSCLNAVAAGSDGAHRVALSLMQRNSMYSKRNFGSQADNATCIVMYLAHSDVIPTDTDTSTTHT